MSSNTKDLSKKNRVKKEEGPEGVPQRGGTVGMRFFSGLSQDTIICIILFLTGLFIITALSSPGLYLNDEWIPVNQVHQLDIGHQITFNEGKYGVYKNGTPAPYFAELNNLLKYSVALPLISLPSMKLIHFWGDNFRLALVAAWACIPFLIAFLVSHRFPEYASLRSIRITILGAVAGILLFMLNLFVYSPFVYSTPDAPVEVAAVCFTNHVLFAFLLTITYLIGRRIFDGRLQALFVTLTVAACSSYFFWGTTGKDHIASAVVFAIVLYFFIRYLQSYRYRDAACGFLFIGVLVWLRPEAGFSVFLCTGIFFIAVILFRVQQSKVSVKHACSQISAILFTGLGAIPFFINNLLITGNPLMPVLLYHDKTISGSTIIKTMEVPSTIISSQAVTSNTIVTTNPLVVVGDLITTVGQYIFTINLNPEDILGILFFPATGSSGVFLVCPVALIALVMAPVLFFWKREVGTSISGNNTRITVFLLVAIFAIFLAYFRIFHDMNTNWASGSPDIRYFSLMYLPLVLVSMILLKKTALLAHPKKLIVNTAGLSIILVPLIIVTSILVFSVFSTFTFNYYKLFHILVSGEIILSIVIVTYYHSLGRKADWISDLPLPLLLITVFAWQVLLVFLMSPVIKFNGYSFWIPGTDVLYHFFISSSISV